jgi:hypothetical protein
MKLSQLVDYSIGLSAVPASTTGFSVPLLLVDATEIPIDKRYRQVTRSTYATTLSGAAETWAATLWGQNYNPASAYIGRWVSAASSPHFIMPSPGANFTTWAAVTAGDFAVTDGTNTDQVTTGTMAAVTSLADVAAVIQTALQNLTPTITGLDSATCSVDALGRLVITNSTTGSTAATISIIAPSGGSGTDISGTSYLNIAAGFGVAGLDAEDPDDALAAILVLDNTPFIIHEIGASIAQQTALAVACAAQKKFYEINVRDADAKSAVATTDIAYALSALGNNNAHGTYTEHTTQYPSAAIGGEIMPLPEGTGQLSNHVLAQVSESGLDSDGTTVLALTDDERSALEDKGCDYLIKPVTSTHLRHGLTFGGIEVRHRVGYYWAEARTTEEIYAYLLVNRVTTFSDKHIQAIGATVAKYLDILVERECCEPGYTLNLPSAADISLVEKATHTLTLSDVAAIISQYAINDVVLTATATV